MPILKFPVARVFLLALTLTCAGCATTTVTETRQQARTLVLTQALEKLSPEVSHADAAAAAAAAVRFPLQLARQWHVTPPAIWNNILVNLHIHPEGLCYQWADALTVKLMSQHLRTLEIHRGVARLGTAREHSCVVLTAPGQGFATGIALDAWRHCGKIHFAPVSRDQYAWQEVDLIPSYQAELETAAEKMEAASKQP